MASLPISLKRKRRLDLCRLLGLLDLLALYLAAGFDLSYAWNEAQATRILCEAQGKNLLAQLQSLSKNYTVASHRVWFGALAELYIQGSPLQPLVLSFGETLRKERARDMDRHARELPTRVSILLLLFFLPAAFLLLFVPLLLQLSSSFSP